MVPTPVEVFPARFCLALKAGPCLAGGPAEVWCPRRRLGEGGECCHDEWPRLDAGRAWARGRGPPIPDVELPGEASGAGQRVRAGDRFDHGLVGLACFTMRLRPRQHFAGRGGREPRLGEWPATQGGAADDGCCGSSGSPPLGCCAPKLSFPWGESWRRRRWCAVGGDGFARRRPEGDGEVSADAGSYPARTKFSSCSCVSAGMSRTCPEYCRPVMLSLGTDTLRKNCESWTILPIGIWRCMAAAPRPNRRG